MGATVRANVDRNESPQYSNTSLETALPSKAISNVPKVGWLLIIASTAFYSITIAFAFGNSAITNIQYLSLSPARTLTILRVLSEATSISLTALIINVTERTLWLLASQESGIGLADFLALHAGTQLLGWLQLLFGKRVAARKWTIIKILLAASVPVLSVVLLVDVTFATTFDQHSRFPVSAGVGTFNASWAALAATTLATTMGDDISNLLQINDISYPSEPVSGCSVSSTNQSTQCAVSYFIHGGMNRVEPWPFRNTSFPNADAFVLDNVRGLQLDFNDLANDTKFDVVRDCLVIGSKEWAIGVCLSQGSDSHIVNAKLVYCPSKQKEYCLADESWLHNSGWAVELAVYTRRGTVNFSRTKSTTFSISDLSQASAVPTSPQDLLYVYKVTLKDQIDPNAGPPENIPAALGLVAYLDVYLNDFHLSPVTYNLARTIINNFFAVPLIFFQPTLVSPWTVNYTISADGTIKGFPRQEGLYTTASFATSRYGMLIARWSLWIYAIGLGLILCICLVPICVATFGASFRRKVPQTTAWPVLDTVANCSVANGFDEDDVALVKTFRDVKCMVIDGHAKNRTVGTSELRIRIRPDEKPAAIRSATLEKAEVAEHSTAIKITETALEVPENAVKQEDRPPETAARHAFEGLERQQQSNPPTDKHPVQRASTR